MTEPNPNSPKTVVAGATPGAILKEARKAHSEGLSVSEVAARLCLSVQTIEDIERDDYQHMSARVYARGHVLSYAHLLGVPEDQVLSVLDNVNMEFVSPKPIVSVDTSRSLPIYQTHEVTQQRSGLLMWGSILVLLIVIGLAVMWWKGGPSADITAPPNATTGSTATSVQIKPQQPAVSTAAPTTPSQPNAQAPVVPLKPGPTPAVQPPAVALPEPAATPPAKPSASANGQDVTEPSESASSSGNSNDASLPAPRGTDE